MHNGLMSVYLCVCFRSSIDIDSRLREICAPSVRCDSTDDPLYLPEKEVYSGRVICCTYPIVRSYIMLPMTRRA